jgi:hypothetical protein
MLNKELWMVLLPAAGWFLFALGGTQISETIKGKKWFRRFVFPAVLGGSVLLAGFTWWQALAVFAISCLMLHLGYGERTRWAVKFLVFLGYGLISVPIGVSYWNLITGLGSFILFILSNIPFVTFYRDTFAWKVCEGMFGCLIGIQVSFLLAGYGLVFFK